MFLTILEAFLNSQNCVIDLKLIPLHGSRNVCVERACESQKVLLLNCQSDRECVEPYRLRWTIGGETHKIVISNERPARGNRA